MLLENYKQLVPPHPPENRLQASALADFHYSARNSEIAEAMTAKSALFSTGLWLLINMVCYCMKQVSELWTKVFK